MDCVWKVPAILQRSDVVFAETDAAARADGLRESTARCLEVDARLHALYDDFDKSISGPLYWPQLSGVDGPAEDAALGKIFPVSFFFPAFPVAQALIVYWLSLMVLHGQLARNYGQMARAAAMATARGAPPGDGDGGGGSAEAYGARARQSLATMEANARCICQAVEYMLQETMGWLGTYAMLSPLAGTLNCYQQAFGERRAREAAWIQHFMHQIEGRCNFEAKSLWEADGDGPDK